MPGLTAGDRVFHVTFGEGVVEGVRAEAATVRFAGGKPKTILVSHLELRRREGPPPRPADAGTLFDVYLMVDWSANGKPKTGSDSIWYCFLEPSEGRSFTRNPSTRQQAFEEIRNQLIELVARGRRVLVGFDFPYGFPRGTAERLGFSGGPPWREMWDELSLLVEDGIGNQNNRFTVAAEINGAMTTGPAPFWGCPPGTASAFLQAKKPQPWPTDTHEFRLAEKAVPGPKPIWQLLGAGCVGSQALLGIPRVAALRDDPALQGVSQVWPFEIQAPPARVPSGDMGGVVYAEIYPSLVPPSLSEEIKDAGQVRALAEHFARLDDEGELSAAFDLSALSSESLQAASGEEGWILGAKVDDGASGGSDQ
ncbi:MAG: cobalamin biosynthesis protein CbiG [Actinobacteria bacterium]|nr:cobalamin biosynthesis protein CbiG [Actinomycetota bacterium]